jgi:hypothetical protein
MKFSSLAIRLVINEEISSYSGLIRDVFANAMTHPRSIQKVALLFQAQDFLNAFGLVGA